MAIPRADIVATWVSEEGTNNDFRILRDIIFEIISSRLSENSDDERLEISENIESDVAHELDNITEQNNFDGIIPRFLLSIDGSTFYIKYINRPELHLLNNLRTSSPENFEHFCKKLLNTLGGNAIVQGGSTDGGVDFFCFDLPINGIGSPSPKGSKVLLIGQAKRYAPDNYVTEHDIRSFIGSATRKLFLLKKDYPSKVGIIHPAVYAFWTTGDFNRSAKQLANEMGLWYLNGIALTQLAIRIGINDHLVLTA